MDDIKIKGYIVKRREEEPSVLRGGFIKIDPSKDEYAQHFVNKMQGYDGRELEITISDSNSYTARMNRLFHALVHKVHQSGQCSYWNLMGRAPETFSEVKNWIKIELGGAEFKKIGDYAEIQSWTTFSKKKASQCIDSVINWCMEVGIDIDEEKLESNSLKEAK
jgi:hypothetical protein